MSKSALKLVHGGKSYRYRVGDISCKVNTLQSVSQDLDAVVFEEDTHLILTVDSKFTYTENHPVRMMTEVHRAKTNRPGSLIIHNRSWYAVTIDLDCDPICRLEWVRKVYGNIESQVEKSNISTLGLFLLGNYHGGLAAEECIQTFIEEVQLWNTCQLKEVCLIVPDALIGKVRDRLANRKIS